VVNPCVSALVAAEQLTGSNPQLAVSNAAFSGACSGGKESMLHIEKFCSHHLAAQMPVGERPGRDVCAANNASCLRHVLPVMFSLTTCGVSQARKGHKVARIVAEAA
jgi:hypothetical protein